MTMTIWLHVFTGALALTAGALALIAKKGSVLHRKSGMVFVVAMLIMSVTGALTAAIIGVRISVIVGTLAFYLVLTSVLTVRPLAEGALNVNIGLMLIGAIAGIAGLLNGAIAIAAGKAAIDGYPVSAFFIFGSVALIGALLDARMIWKGGVKGKHRIARHLWRMCIAMYIATAAFFLGQPKVFPAALQNSWILAIPVLLVLIALIYWLARTLLSQKVVVTAG